MPWKILPQAIAWACLAMPLAASAHDLWLEPQGDSLVLRYGHRGGEVLDLDASKVKGIRCTDEQVQKVVARAKEMMG